MSSGKCQLMGCKNEATSVVRLKLAANADHEPAVSSPILQLCETHATECTFDSLVNEENWQKLCNAFDKIGRMRPKKEFSGLLIEPISKPK